MSSEKDIHILVVDDTSDFRILIAKILDCYDVKTAGTSKEAITIIDEFDLDLIFLDIRLEFNNPENYEGLSILHHAKNKNPNTEIIICSGYRADIREKGLKDYDRLVFLNKDEFISKEAIKTAARNLLLGKLNKTN